MSLPSQNQGGSPMAMSGPPYLAPVAMPGLVPSKSTDIPAASVLMIVFLGLLVSNVLILRQNKRARTPFALSALLIIYSILRTVAMIMRIAYATHPHDVNLTIVANVLANAGVILIIILNLLLMPRLLGGHFGPSNIAARPGLKKLTTLPFFIPIPLVPIFLLITVNVVVLSFFTTDPQTRQNCLTVQKVALTVFAVIAFVPVLPALAIAILGSSTPAVQHSHGSLASRVLNPPPGFGSTRTNALLILFGSAVLTLGSSIRTAALMLPARMASDPAWYHKRPAYYIFTFVTEILVVGAYVFFRIDRRFQLPAQADGEKQPQTGATNTPEERGLEDAALSDTVDGDEDRKGHVAEGV